MVVLEGNDKLPILWFKYENLLDFHTFQLFALMQSVLPKEVGTAVWKAVYPLK